MVDKDIYEKLSTYCAYQERCMADVKKKLSLLEVNKEDYLSYIIRLQEDNFLNEDRYTKSYVNAHIKKKWGKVKIKSALSRKGISSETIVKHLDDVAEDDYQERLLKLVTDKAPRIKAKDKRDGRIKLMRHLLGKGYAMADINNAIKQAGVFK